MPNFNVQNAQLIYPAADLSEQISTAGKEASGTGNMKFMMNGALTIGTLDGANVEIREEVGAENFFLFGLTAEEVATLKRDGYRPADHVDGNDELRAVLELIGSGHFSRGDAEVFRPLVENLTQSDPFLVLADYAAYIECQDRVSAAWQDSDNWARMSIFNTAAQRKILLRPCDCRILRSNLGRPSRHVKRERISQCRAATQTHRDGPQGFPRGRPERKCRVGRRRRAAWGHDCPGGCQFQPVLETRHTRRVAVVRSCR